MEKYHSEGAKVLLLTMGSFSETASVAIDELRAKGMDVGQIRLRLWRPFPFEELREAVKDADVLIVLDRAISFGGPGGPVASEVKAALYNQAKKPKVVSFVGGLGGRDITVAGFKDIIKKGIEIAAQGQQERIRDLRGEGIMEKYAFTFPDWSQKEENFAPGHRACIGCGEALAVRLAFKALGNNVIVVNATGCMEIVASQLP